MRLWIGNQVMGEVLLKWKNHDKDLSGKLWEYFKEEYLVDFCVTCHGQQKKVHKFVLAFLFPMLKESLRSSGTIPFDQQELTSDGSSGESSKIPEAQCLSLDNIAYHAEDMDYLIQFVYTGKTTVPEEHADCLLRIADTMEIKSLKESLGQWNTKSKPKNEPNDVTPSTRLRPRTQTETTNSESVDIVSSIDDLETNSIASDEESSMSNSFDSVVWSDDFTYDEDDDDEDDDEDVLGDGESISGSKKKKAQQNKVALQKRQNDGSKKKSETETLQNETKPSTDETSSQERATMSTKGSKIKEKKVRNLKCDQCDYVGKYPYRLQRHLKKHALKQDKGPKQYICKTCNKDLKTKSLLAKHRATKCGTDIFVCKYCGHTARQKNSLNLHVMAVHQVDAEGNPLEKIKCPDCDFICYANHQLQYHKRAKHKYLNKFKCKECNYAAPYVGQVMKHHRVMHQNIRNFMCEECGYRFTTSGRLNDHVLARHKGVKRHKCNICNAEYSDKLSFKIHMQRHEGKVEYKFVCHICGHNLRRKYELRTHMRKKHGMELEEKRTEVSEPCQLQYPCDPTSTCIENMM